MQGKFKPGDIDNNRISYNDSKLHINILTMAVARKWPGVCSNVVNPGWVPTKMGGAEAIDDLQKGYETQVWLATSDEHDAKVSGCYFFHKKQKKQRPEANDVNIQDEFLLMCERITGVRLPEG